jgi:uncharacterized protein YbaR (Trm112 family)
MEDERDGELACPDCKTPMYFKGERKLKKYGRSDHWYCSECEETIRIDEDGNLIED